MALTTSYLITTKNLEGILKSIQTAQAPKKFSLSFLESLDFKSTNDRLIIGVLKALGFLTDSGEPTDRYYRFLDQSLGARVLAEGIREAYGDLFAVNINAHQMSKADVKGKLKTLTQGKPSDNVLNLMAATFEALCKLADFTQPEASSGTPPLQKGDVVEEKEEQPAQKSHKGQVPPAEKGQAFASFGSLQYVINIQLPESRNQAVYDALFRSLKEHLMR